MLTILAAVFLYSNETRFPGIAAALPCLGAAAIIHAGSGGETWIGRALSFAPWVGVGLISYSLYLWHWPVLVFAKAYALRPLSPMELGVLLAGCVLFAYVSWRYVEQPFRRKGWLSRSQVFVYSGVASGLLASAGAVLWLGNGLPSRLPADVRALLNVPRESSCPALSSLTNFRENGPCVATNGPIAKGTILWGDSHARSLLPALRSAAEREQARLAIVWSTACPPLLGMDRVDSPDARCAEKAEAVYAWLAKSQYKHVILAARWALSAEGSRYGQETGAPARLRDVTQASSADVPQRDLFRIGFERTIARLRQLGIQVTVIASVPEAGVPVPETLARVHWWNRSFEVRPARSAFQERQRFVLQVLAANANRDGVRVLYPHESLCNATHCAVEDHGHALYLDDDHLSPASVERLAVLMRSAFAPE
jgi:hypothetical protein